jgi:hypothetical protein
MSRIINCELCGSFDQFPKYHMGTLLGDFNAKVDCEDIIKLIDGK